MKWVELRKEMGGVRVLAVDWAPGGWPRADPPCLSRSPCAGRELSSAPHAALTAWERRTISPRASPRADDLFGTQDLGAQLVLGGLVELRWGQPFPRLPLFLVL